ncbi:ankyrin repeat protein [Owenweeksia hongkongensis DSM 17368]|uniref:Ankyrin repeat protein n=1 Tax=Owenweeksia hongkongensis (strain DSM 17368 / CIP 108786 / JCM 12287 / NRRL B-23963 / UST20020801) TaxID=926562 RepID=G8R8L5_OWEHD|nr:ankyrin repeat domain-containing protein [Owenweeksia hongkongensis]AEV31397.1 ankyrin repeat protein [Owenweeksia hongkongensis DSM 17368]
MNFWKTIFKKVETAKSSGSIEQPKVERPNGKLTIAKKREFFGMIKNEEFDHLNEISSSLDNYPELANEVVSGLSKGIDGFSSLMLSIRFYNFSVAKLLVKRGADVNYIDSSQFRKNHHPVLFDLIETIRDVVELGNFDAANKALELWDLMDSNGLDYLLKSEVSDGINQSQNCLEAFLRLVGVKYGNRHMVAKADSKVLNSEGVNMIFKLGKEDRDLEKEMYYKEVASRILNNISEEALRDIDANRFRSWSTSILPFYRERGFVDTYALTLVNDIVIQKYGFEINNIKDSSYIKANFDGQIPGVVDCSLDD